MTLPYQLDRIVTIHAPRDTVFSFFTDSARWASWWGAGSTIDARPGGRVHIVHPNKVEMTGEVLEVAAPERITFTYGYTSGSPIPAGGSRVTITLDADGLGTRLHLTHEFDDEGQRDHHVQGWRFQLSLFSNAVADVVHADAAAKVDAWFGAWADPDAATRASTLAAIAAPDVRFMDRFSTLTGLEDVREHITAAQRFMPGLMLRRTGGVRQCQGTVLADWEAVSADGTPRGAGTNVFVFDGSGRITTATGLWKPS